MFGMLTVPDERLVNLTKKFYLSLLKMILTTFSIETAIRGLIVSYSTNL